MERKELNQKHLYNPQPGDYWEDHLVACLLVLDASRFAITICKSKKDIDQWHWTWDLSKMEVMTPKDFRKWLSYGSIPGTWADVHPGAHYEFVKEALQLIEE